MNTAASRTTSRATTQAATSRQRIGTVDARRLSPMPRSTTRVIWTMSQGTMVEYGEIS